MGKTILVLLFLLSFSQLNFAQVPLPRPVAETEIRDNTSVKMRSIQLERLKREADRPVFKKDKELNANFSQIKEDFEEIQRLENEITRIYITAKEIDFRKIGELAEQITKRAARLKTNLFSVKTKSTENPKPVREAPRELIIALDRAVSAFVKNPVFNNLKLVGQKDAETCQGQIEQIIEKSIALAQRARGASGN